MPTPPLRVAIFDEVEELDWLWRLLFQAGNAPAAHQTQHLALAASSHTPNSSAACPEPPIGPFLFAPPPLNVLITQAPAKIQTVAETVGAKHP
ncbi:hypothetical protein E2320_022530 [Naja naja]|nr:hypothetical protein E2320_022530 [Naja naja]